MSYFRLKIQKMPYLQKVAYLTLPDTPGGIRVFVIFCINMSKNAKYEDESI